MYHHPHNWLRVRAVDQWLVVMFFALIVVSFAVSQGLSLVHDRLIHSSPSPMQFRIVPDTGPFA